MLNSQQEAQLKAMEEAMMRQKQGYVGQAQTVCDNAKAYRPTLRDRLKRQIESANETQSAARSANELYDLLDKHQDVARILELWEEIGGRGF